MYALVFYDHLIEEIFRGSGLKSFNRRDFSRIEFQGLKSFSDPSPGTTPGGSTQEAGGGEDRYGSLVLGNFIFF